ncbi:MAG: hypothetical protein ACJ75S_06915 [Solirubrobacterales bacterium]|jgi:ribulose bisphosphate carboxylase small subunit
MPAEQEEATFTLRGWGEKTPTNEMLADELERIAALVRQGYLSGDAFADEDYPGRGWWDMANFEGTD